MWDKSLSGTEIKAVLEDGVDPSAPGLVGLWSFDEGAGQELADNSPAQNDGFLEGDPGADSGDPFWTQ